MNKKNKVRITIAVFILVAVLSIGVFLRINQNNTENSKRPPMIVNVKTGFATKGEINRYENLTASIYSIQQANIYSKVSGNIEKIYKDIGDYVSQGQSIALIDTTIYSQNEHQAYAAYMQTLANMQNSKILYERNKSLFDQNLIAKQDLDNSKTTYDISLAQKDAAYANYINSKTQLSYCNIVAPFSGYITKRYFDAGVYITASTANAGSILFILANLEKLKAMVYIPEKDVDKLKDVKDIQIYSDALPGKSFQGKIAKMSGSLDLSTRTMEIEVDIENSNKVLKPGMFVKISLILEKKLNTIIVPNDAVQNDNDGDYVYTINQNMTASKKYVKVGIKQDTRWEILSGIDEKDNLVMVGQNLLKDNAKVKLMK